MAQENNPGTLERTVTVAGSNMGVVEKAKRTFSFLKTKIQITFNLAMHNFNKKVCFIANSVNVDEFAWPAHQDLHSLQTLA